MGKLQLYRGDSRPLILIIGNEPIDFPPTFFDTYIIREFDPVDHVFHAIEMYAPAASLVILDYDNSIELLEKLQNSRPGLPILVCASECDVGTTFFTQESTQFLTKPIQISTLIHMINHLIAKPV